MPVYCVHCLRQFQIKNVTCPNEEGKDNRCSFYSGDLTLKVPVFGFGKFWAELLSNCCV